MKIITTTQTHNAEALIGDALRSVLPFADACLVVDSGATDKTIAVATDMIEDQRKYYPEQNWPGTSLVLRKLDWADDFSTARNYHLDEATRLGYDWAVTLDTDERIEGLTRKHFEEATADVLMVRAKDGSYAKHRCFRLPTTGRWHDPVHEGFVYGGSQQELEGVRFWEVEKTLEQKVAKFERIARILRAEVKVNPSPRKWYYLGDTLAGMHEFYRISNVEESEACRWSAIQSFHSCTALKGWAEEAAWAMFRAGELHCLKDEYELSLQCCLDGMKVRPGMADLHWLAAWASWQLRRVDDAVWWATASAALGLYCGIGVKTNHVLPRHWRYGWAPLYEGPFDILRHAYRRVGNEELARRSEVDFRLATEKRVREIG